MHNVYLTEATEEINKTKKVIADIKKNMNTCRLTKFQSVDECSKFYHSFFMNSVEGLTEPLTLDQWSQIYNTLLNDNKFNENLAYYISIYRPLEYRSMFGAIRNMIDVEALTVKDKIMHYSKASADVSMITRGFEVPLRIIQEQNPSPDTTKFMTIIRMTLESISVYAASMMKREITTEDPDDITILVSGVSISESAQELIDVLSEAAEFWETEDPMNEGIVNKTKEAAQALAVKIKKFENEFDLRITKKWQKIRQDRQTRKHSEIVGESLRIMNEFKRIMKVAPVAIISPGLAFITWAVSLGIDRHTDRKDRDVLVGQLKDELEIIEDKINTADRNGADKERVELIRVRQKLTREYERISKIKYRKRM